MSIPLENQKYPRAINHILKKVGVSEPSIEAYMYQKQFSLTQDIDLLWIKYLQNTIHSCVAVQTKLPKQWHEDCSKQIQA